MRSRGANTEIPPRFRPHTLGLLALVLVAPACGGGEGAARPDACPTTGALCGEDARTPDDGAGEANPTDGGADANDANRDTSAGEAGTGARTLVVDPEWAVAHVDDPTVLFVDARDGAAFLAGHLPGAVSVPVAQLLTSRDGLEDELVDAPVFAETVGEAGVTRTATVVVYEDTVGYTAGRVFFTFDHFGHPDVRVLDGGLEAFRKAAGAVESGPGKRAAVTYGMPTPRPETVADADYVLAHLADPEVAIVDARSASEYGAGHIPGAINLDWNAFVTGGRLRARSELAALVAAAGLAAGKEAITYCSRGWRAAVDAFVLQHVGFARVRVYDGSWAEWGSRPDLPQEK